MSNKINMACAQLQMENQLSLRLQNISPSYTGMLAVLVAFYKASGVWVAATASDNLPKHVVATFAVPMLQKTSRVTGPNYLPVWQSSSFSHLAAQKAAYFNGNSSAPLDHLHDVRLLYDELAFLILLSFLECLFLQTQSR